MPEGNISCDGDNASEQNASCPLAIASYEEEGVVPSHADASDNKESKRESYDSLKWVVGPLFAAFLKVRLSSWAFRVSDSSSVVSAAPI